MGNLAKLILKVLDLTAEILTFFKKLKRKQEEKKLDEEITKKDDDLTMDNLSDLLD